MRAFCRLLLLSGLWASAFLLGCGDKQPAPPDSAPPDAPLPPGPQGDVLRVAETGTVELPGLSAPVQVLRVEAGVPHIYAANEHDLRMVQGYLTGRDRLFFFDVARRLGQGRVSEILGDAALATDVRARGQGMTHLTDRLMEHLTPAQESTFDAFVAGLNAYVDAATAGREPAPSEFDFLRLVLGLGRATDILEPFTRRDVAAFAIVITYQQGFETDEPHREEVLAALDGAFEGLPDAEQRYRAAVSDLWGRVASVAEVSSLPGFGLTESTPAATRRPTPSAARLPAEMMARLEARNALTERFLRGGRGADFGSNEWSVMGRATRDGRALLAGDGHLPLSVPALFQQVGLDTQVFGDPETGMRQVGMVFPGIPFMGPGTNGYVAWTITYFDGDITDWYREELRLTDDGQPESTMFDGTWRPLNAAEETYVIRDVPALGSEGRTEMHRRWTTFDGRWIAAIEGDAADADATPGPGQALLNIQGDWVIPRDTNGDGVVSAVSFDYTGFDMGNNLISVDEWGRARSVQDVREASRRLVAFAQNVMAADVHGDIYFDGGYSATPCRSHLPRDPDGRWVEGADPRRLIDGTRFGGFEVQLDENGMPDESESAPCIVPFDEWPQGLSPDTGFLFNANNDTAQLTFDGRLDNDAWYIGGPFAPGFRGQTIRDGLQRNVEAGTADLERMRELQADHHSSLGLLAAPFLLEALHEAERLDLSSETLTSAEQRLLELYRGGRAMNEEVRGRLESWLERGAIAASGVSTFYDADPTDDDQADATATMIFNTWLRQFFSETFDDEPMDFLWSVDPRSLRAAALQDLIQGRGPGNPRNIEAWSAVTQESIFFDRMDTPEVETAHEIALRAINGAIATLLAPPTSPGAGGFGTSDMSAWLWGLRHQVVFDSFLITFAGDTMGIDLIAGQLGIDPERLPLAEGLAEDDPRYGLLGFPRPGDFFAVDAANPPFTGPDFHYRNGPVMRMVIALGPDNITGVNILPGGQSALVDSPNFSDQAELWLRNETYPMRFTLEEVIAGASGRESFTP